MASIPTDNRTLNIPIYIHLPLHPETSERRQLLLTVFIRRIDSRHTAVEVTSDQVITPHPYQPGRLMQRPTAPTIQGVRYFMPRNAMTSPIYIVVSRVLDTILESRLLIAISISEWLPTDDDPLRVHVDARHIDSETRAARAIALLPPHPDTLRTLNSESPRQSQPTAHIRAEMPLNNARSFNEHIRMVPTNSLPDINDEDTYFITVHVDIDTGRLALNSQCNRVIHVELYIYREKDQHSTWIDAARYESLPENLSTTTVPPEGTRIFVPACPLQMPTFVIVERVQDDHLQQPIIITIRLDEWLPGVENSLELQLDVSRFDPTRTFLTTAPNELHSNYVNATDLMRFLGITPAPPL
ncbi:hypothetical protein C2E23DRAFT_886331 [Lenzites betulinus]|nr:hypothetical protein C2E23DRAFT_886331 [Lenzites betulinus]